MKWLKTLDGSFLNAHHIRGLTVIEDEEGKRGKLIAYSTNFFDRDILFMGTPECAWEELTILMNSLTE